MTTPASELVVRGAALYLPITVSLALALYRTPDRRRLAAAAVGVAWNLSGLLALNAIAQHVGWWAFSATTAVVAGIPVDLWIGWALLWGAVPMLVHTRRLVVIGLQLVAVDLVVMPMAAPVVSLGPTWLLGELACVATCLFPGLLLGRWTTEERFTPRRAGLQAVAFGGLLLYVLPTLIFTVTGEDWTALLARPRWHFVIAALIAAPPGAMALQAVREFAVAGDGTPVPLDPPHRLVTTGPYAYVANPMQLGATLLLAEWGVLVRSAAIVAAALMGALFAAGVAAWTEQRELSERFGDDWATYRAQVSLWFPRWRPYVGPVATVLVATTCEPCREIGRFVANRKPRGVRLVAAEDAAEPPTRLSYRAPSGHTETGLAALGRSLEHVNLAWAVASWALRLPLVAPFLQLVADAVGGGPRQLVGHHVSSTGRAAPPREAPFN